MRIFCPEEGYAPLDEAFGMLDRIRNLRADRLSLLLGLIDSPGDALTDFAAMCDQQFAFRIAPAANDSGAGEWIRLQQMASTAEPAIQSVGDLLNHPYPPLELLVWAKDRAKMCTQSLVSHVPPEVGSVLYYSCIAAALLSHQTVISDLGLEDLTAGFEWCLAQNWVRENTHALLEKGHAAVVMRLKSGGETR